MLSYCLKCRKIRKVKTKKVAKTIKRKNDAFIKLCGLSQDLLKNKKLTDYNLNKVPFVGPILF